MQVTILGCGPAGLFAAHAAMSSGHEVQIYSKARKSLMHGAQYLHQPIPGLSRDPFKIRYELVGTTAGYREKVYGDTEDILVSPETLVGVADAWDIREAYDAAWDKYGGLVQEWDASSQWIPTGDLVISTVPAPLLCDHPAIHDFESQRIWSTDKLKKSILDSGLFDAEDDNLVLCSGDPEDYWYRASRIHGWENTEFPYHRRPRQSRHEEDGYQVFEVVKPIRTSCDCYPEILRLGRFGTWTKGVLSHTAYYKVEEILS